MEKTIVEHDLSFAARLGFSLLNSEDARYDAFACMEFKPLQEWISYFATSSHN